LKNNKFSIVNGNDNSDWIGSFQFFQLYSSSMRWVISKLDVRVLLDWIGGLLNPDCNPIQWIGLWLTIQSQNWILDLDCQPSFSISIQIQTIAVYLENVIEYNSHYITKNVFDYNYKYPSEKSNQLPGTSSKKERLLE